MSAMEIHVKTGDVKGGGTDANVYICLYNEEGKSTEPVKLDKWFHNDMERGQTDKYKCPDTRHLGKITEIEIWRDGWGVADAWLCEVVSIVDTKTGDAKHFPLQCWTEQDRRYRVTENGTSLPQDDPRPEVRAGILKERQKTYATKPRLPGLPTEVAELPPEEYFSEDIKEETQFVKRGLKLKALWAKIKTFGEFDTWEEVNSLYKGIMYEEPKGLNKNSATDDEAFGAQRLVGCNPTQVQLCTELPANLPVTDEMTKEHMEGMSLRDALQIGRLFVVNHHILKDFELPSDRTLCAPIGLFFLTSRRILKPVAIQLFQEPSADNPIFTPSDPTYTWQAAKMWFNNADANVHQTLTHLAFTHLMMEGVSCASHRQLAPQHPIFRLLAPHFLYLIAINWNAHDTLLGEGGWIEKTMTVGRNGFFAMLLKQAMDWRLDVEGTLPKELEARGVMSSDVLPVYPYRDDGLLYYHAISRYVRGVVDIFYKSSEFIAKDNELQAWGKDLAMPVEKGGIGLKGIPNGGRFETADDIVLVCTSVIFTCSVQHAAVNFGQYDEFGYPQNYPPILHGSPPKDKKPLTNDDLLKMHPNLDETLNAVVATTVLSRKATNSLGDWERRYNYDPRVLEAEQKFRVELKKIGEEIQTRIKARPAIYEYDYLLPESIPNAISI